MYGLFPALMETQRFRADQEQRQADMAMRQQDQAMRQRQMAMQEEQHRLQNQEIGLRMKRAQEEDTAVASLADLQKRDAESQQFNGTGLMRPVDDREMNNAEGAVALARRDMTGLAKSRNANRMLDVNEEAKRLAADPAFQAKAMDYISTKEIFPLKVVPGQRDPKSGRMKTADRLEFDSGFKYELKDGDRQRIALGAALMSKGMNEEGLKVIEGVNKELRDAVDHANKRTVSASEFNSKADDRLADNDLRAEQIATQRALRAGAAANRNPEADPKLLKEYNDLVAAYQTAMDGGDTKRAKELRAQLVVKQAQVSTSMRKPMALRDETQPRPERTMTPKDRLEMATKIMDSPGGQGLSLDGALQVVDRMVASSSGAAPPNEMEQLREALRAQNAPKPKPGLQTQRPAAPATFETMPLQVLQGYTGTSPEARAIYVRRLAEQERLAQQPRFWVNQPRGAETGEFGLDRGY